MRLSRNAFAMSSALAGLLALAACSSEREATPEQAGNGEDTIELAEFPDRPYWGDTHLHTDIPMDAGAFRNPLGRDASQVGGQAVLGRQA